MLVKKPYREKLIKVDGIFLNGFLTKVEKYCNQNNLSISIDRSFLDSLFLPIENQPKVSDLNITEGDRDYQGQLIRIAVDKQRGVIKAATASGKTIIMLGIISCYPSSKILFLSDTYVPISQFKEGIEKYHFSQQEITCGTIHSFYKKSIKELSEFNIIIIDECHGVGSFDGMYAKLLYKSTASIRLGFTATLPNTLKGKLALEGLLGPVLGELTIQEGVDKGVIVKPKIIIKKIPLNSKVRGLTRYKTKIVKKGDGSLTILEGVYDSGVVNNRTLNRIITRDVRYDLKKDRTVLILVQEIKHGLNIVEIAKRLFDIDIVFVQGSTEGDLRDEIRLAMEDRKIKVVVATSVFRKALNIPSLDVIVNACGGKSEVMTLQAIGRGLRISEGKEKVIIRDYFNPSHHYLISHFGERLSMYFDNHWM